MAWSIASWVSLEYQIRLTQRSLASTLFWPQCSLLLSHISRSPSTQCLERVTSLISTLIVQCSQLSYSSMMRMLMLNCQELCSNSTSILPSSMTSKSLTWNRVRWPIMVSLYSHSSTCWRITTTWSEVVTNYPSTKAQCLLSSWPLKRPRTLQTARSHDSSSRNCSKVAG